MHSSLTICRLSKLGVWQDGYYLSVNRFNTNSGSPFVGVGAAVLERPKMLTGDPTARMVYFKSETLGGSGSGAGSNCCSMLPSIVTQHLQPQEPLIILPI